MKIKDIQANLDTLKPIKFSDKTKSFNNIKEIVEFACSKDYKLDNSTKINNKLQCFSNRARGIADLYRICKYYFPNVKLKEVIETVKNIPMRYGYCYTTNQDVFMINCVDQNLGYSWEADKNDPSIRLKNRKRVYIES